MTETICARVLLIAILFVAWVLQEPTDADIAEAHRLTLDEDARAVMDALNAEDEGEIVEAWA